MPSIQDDAIVLKRLDFSETSQVLAVMTSKHGKVRIMAKGSRRSTKHRFNPGMDLLEAGRVVLSVRNIGQEALANLTEWKQSEAFLGLRERLDRLNAAQYAADVTAHLTEDWDPHPQIFHGLCGTLHSLSEGGGVLSLLVAFQRAVLNEAGMLPRLDRCVVCSRPPAGSIDIYFSSFEGGLLCRDCEPARIEKRLVRMSRQALLDGGWQSEADVGGAFDLLSYHIAHLMGRPPAAHAFLVGMAERAFAPRP